MSVGKLPDFANSLTFCISARKHLIYIYKQQNDNELDILRQSNIIKSTIERNYRNNGVTCTIMSGLSFDTSDLSTENKNESGFEIIVIPNICAYGKDEQIKLVKIMKASEAVQSRIFIGMVPWDMTSNDVNIIDLQDWLKHRFWISCLAPNEQEILNSNAAENINYKDVYYSPAIRRYILDIMVHLRMHRFVDITKAGGIQTTALKDMLILSQLVSWSKFKKPFVTPEHVKFACLWYFPMHIDLLKSSKMDTTVLYGSKPHMIDDFLKQLQKLNHEESRRISNPLFLQTLIVRDVLGKNVPPA